MRILALVLAVASIQPSGESAVSNQDVVAFREVLKGGLVPPPDVGDPLGVRSDTSLLPAVNRTLRICGATEPTDDVLCIPEIAISSIAAHATATEVLSLKNRNIESRVIPADQMVVIVAKQVFRGSSTWSAVWSRANVQPLPDCVMFSTPASDDGEMLVYAVRVWQGKAYGWYVRLRADGSGWHVSTKQLVWRSHPAY